MNPLALLLLVVSQVSGVRHAPPDVPKGHWAYQAVDELFQAGLLDGYPGEGSELNAATGITGQNAGRTLIQLYEKNMVPGIHPPDRMSIDVMGPYEQAIAAYVVGRYYMTLPAEQKSTGSVARMNAPTILGLLELRAHEIHRLGGDPAELARQLQQKFGLLTFDFRG